MPEDCLPLLIGNWRAEDEGDTEQSSAVTAAAEIPEEVLDAESEDDGDDDDDGIESEEEPDLGGVHGLDQTTNAANVGRDQMVDSGRFPSSLATLTS